MPPSLRRLANLAMLAALFSTVTLPALGQANPPAAPPANLPAPKAPANPPANNAQAFPSGQEPLTGPIRLGDTVGVLVIDEPTLSGSFVVDTDGKVILPLAGQIKLQGLMPPRAAEEVTRVLKAKKLLRNPQVTVVISARPLRTVLVSGALNQQGRVTIKEGARLNEVLEPAGIGLGSDLSKVEITRGEQDDRKLTINYLKYREGKESGPDVNPVLQDGDKIFVYTLVPASGAARVAGEVQTPQPITVTKGLTVGQAIQQAGGVTNFADRDHIYIQRGPNQVHVPLTDIEARKPNADIALQNEDVINVPRLEKPKEFTVNGAVNAAGPYPLLTRTTLLEAIAKAHGTVDGAREKEVQIRRAQSTKVDTRKYNLLDAQDAAVEIYPGDYIMVPYRKDRPHVDPLTILGAMGSLVYLFGRH